MGTHYTGAPAEARALDTFIKLKRAAESVSARLLPLMHEYGLSESQFGALEVLLHLGPLCQRDLGEKLLRSGGNITMVVDNLEKRALIRRVRSETDRRYVTLHLTDEGERLIREVFPRHAANVASEMSILDAADQEALGRLCRQVGRQQKP